MARTHRTSTTWTGITLAVLLLAGCTGQTPDPPVKASPTPAATPSPTATSVAIAPPRPAAMDDDGPKGAEAAAVYFLELDPYIQTTGDTRTFDSMSHAICEYCSNRSDQAHQIAAEDDQYEGGETTVSILHTYAQDAPTGIWPIDVEVASSPSRITSPTGEVLFETATSIDHMHVEAQRINGQWVIVSVTAPSGS